MEMEIQEQCKPGRPKLGWMDGWIRLEDVRERD